jgi:hypothetical protein
MHVRLLVFIELLAIRTNLHKNVPPRLWPWASHFASIASSFECVSCCGLAFFNIAEVEITGPKWREIKTAVIRKTLNI